MISSFVAWLRNPLDTSSGQPNALLLFLLIGLILVALVLWGLIFRSIREVLVK